VGVKAETGEIVSSAGNARPLRCPRSPPVPSASRATGIAKSVLTLYSFIREVNAAEGVIVRRVEAIHGKTIGAENNLDGYGKQAERK
jgi:hypothetical protein